MKEIKMVTLKAIKLLICCMTITLFVSGNPASAKGIAIDKKNFSANMINYVSHKFDKNNDGYLSNKELKNARKLEFDGDETVQVFDFRGLDKLTYLNEIVCECTEFRNFSPDALKRIKKLSLHDCKIEQLDFEKMPLLEEANIYYVDTKSDYNFKKNIRLKSLDIGGCKVKKLDVSCLKNLERLVIGKGIPVCNLSKNTKLKSFELSSEWDKLDISKNYNLRSLSIYDTKLKTIDLKNQKKLTRLNIRCKNMETINLMAQKKLVELSIICEKCYDIKLPLAKKMKQLQIDAPITWFDSSKIPNIRELKISAVIEHLDFENNKKLKSLYVESKDIVHELALLTEVTGFESLPALEELTMVNCPIGMFNYMHPKLSDIHFINCQLDEIDVTDLPSLYRIEVDKSELANFYAGEKNAMLEQVSFTNCRKLENVVIKRLNDMNRFSYVCKKKHNEPVLKNKEEVWNQETGQVIIMEDTIDLGINHVADSNE